MACNFYDNVEAERARNHMTIAQTAERLGIGEKTYRDRMYQNKDLRVSQIVPYARLFNVSVDYLLGLTDKMRPE